MADTFDEQQARLLGQAVAAVYEQAAQRFRLSPRDIALAALGACAGFAVRAGMSEQEVRETLHTYWTRIRRSANGAASGPGS